jgi:hypothetical protein
LRLRIALALLRSVVLRRKLGDTPKAPRAWAAPLRTLLPPVIKFTATYGVNDHTLDVVADADLVWSWKDEPEFEALIAAGKIRPEKARMVREEAWRVIERIEARVWPFNEPWPEWRPDPSWPVPQIGDYWTPP